MSFHSLVEVKFEINQERTNQMNKKYSVQANSAINPFLRLTLGEGNTIAEAYEDALGEKPWTPYQKKTAKGYFLVENNEDGTYTPRL